jgi:hypothetical protein
MPKKRGISLNIGGDGGVTAVAPEEGELCCGTKICSKCIGNMCQVSNEFVFAMRACPLKKWYILWHASHHDSISVYRYPKENCQVCGDDNFFRVKAILTTTGKKKGDWICATCHPPSPLLKTELKTKGSKACDTSKPSVTT